MATTPINNTGGTGFSNNGGGAAFGNPNITRQGAKSGATQVEYPSSAPPKAPAAPAAGKDNIFTGLCDALNQHQRDLVKAGRYQYPDIYEIKFVPPALAAAQVKKPGPEVDITVTAQQNPNSATKLNTATQKVATNTQTWQVQAGTHIVQLIDQIMRNSTYITDQQLWQYDPVPDPKTGVQKLKKNPKAGTGVTAWYKISVQATQLKYDTKRRDNAYRLTFIINTYALADLHSDYFSPIPYRGVHKNYNYWFTGLNTQILNYEQQIDNMYRLTISGIGNLIAQNSSVSYRDQYRKTYQTASSNRALGAKGPTNEPGDNAAGFLYDIASMVKAKLEIVGDPAWLQQGEVGTGINWPNFNFNPFNADGGINFESQQVLFDISFNQPTDYDLNTGIMNVNSHNTGLSGPMGGLPQANFTYVATHCKSVFSKGTFKQHLEGKLKMESATSKSASGIDTASIGRSVSSAISSGVTAIGNALGSRLPSSDILGGALGLQRFDDGSTLQTFDDGSTLATGTDGSISSSPSQETQPAAPPDAPNSNGDITEVQDYTAPQDAGNIGGGEEVASPPQQIANDDA